MQRSPSTTLVLLGYGWAQATLVLGLAFFDTSLRGGEGLEAGLAMTGVGFFLVMWLVIDKLVPEAGRVFTGILKIAAALLFYGCGAITLYGILGPGPGVL